MKRRSLLESVVNEFIEEDTKKEFIEKIHKDTGVSKKVINEVYSRGYENAKTSGGNPTVWAKARVYSFVEKKSPSKK